jgi:pimeloyl-ACP methyl ester carboxylesterase
LGIDSANVFGFSMGGMIALHLVLRHPERVKRLILGCTSGGGRLAIPPDAPVIESLVNPVSSGDRYDDFINGMWVSISDSFCESNPDTVEQLAQLAANNPQTPEGYTSQMQAILNHDMADRLGEIRVPVMVLHGDSDRLMPPENGRLLAANISGARLILYPGAGHMFFIEQSARVNRDIRDFFAER